MKICNNRVIIKLKWNGGVLMSIKPSQIKFKDAHQYLSWLQLNSDINTHPDKLKAFFVSTNDLYSQCIGLEFLLMNGFMPEFEQLLERNRNSRSKVNREWAFIYDLFLMKQKRVRSKSQLLELVQHFNTEDAALQCTQLFLEIALYFDIFEYGILANRLEELIRKLYAVTDPILRPLFKQRMNMVLFHHYWKRNEMVLARKYGFDALVNMTNIRYLANLHINLSLSYIFEDFELANYHLDETIRIAKEHNLPRLITSVENNNRPFIYAHFNIPNQLDTPIKSVQAHLALARGDFSTAQRILSEVTEDTPFTKYYIGRAFQNRRILLQSYNEFIEQRSDHFFARLPLTALRTL